MTVSGIIRTGTSARFSALGRPVMGAAAAVAAVGLLAACGSDDANGDANGDGENAGTVATSEAAESSESSENSTSETSEATGSSDADGSSSAEASGDYTGWADMDEAIAGLEGQGIECVVPEMEGLEEFAVCQPDGMLSFDMTLEDFEDVMNQEVTQGEAITLVSDGDWTFTCDSTDATVCEDVAEYTGGDVTTLG